MREAGQCTDHDLDLRCAVCRYAGAMRCNPDSLHLCLSACHQAPASEYTGKGRKTAHLFTGAFGLYDDAPLLCGRVAGGRGGSGKNAGAQGSTASEKSFLQLLQHWIWGGDEWHVRVRGVLLQLWDSDRYHVLWHAGGHHSADRTDSAAVRQHYRLFSAIFCHALQCGASDGGGAVCG